MPFVLIAINNKKRKTNQLNSLKAIAIKQQGNISMHELHRDFAIGLDENANCLYFNRKIKDKETVQFVHLSELSQCKLIHSSRARNSKDNHDRLTEKLELCCLMSDRSKPDVVLEFYNIEDSMILTGELQTIEKWAGIVNSRLKSGKQKA